MQKIPEDKLFTLKTGFGEYGNCYFKAGHYQNGNAAIVVESLDEGPIMVCTVNLGDPLPEDEAFIKNYSENQGVESELKRLGIIDEQIGEQPSGFVVIPKYRLAENWKDKVAIFF